MNKEALINELKSSKEFFDRSTKRLGEEHSGFAPKPEMYTTAQQVTHVAQTVDWFLEGATRPEGFNMNFEALDVEVRKAKSLSGARAWLERSYAAIIDWVRQSSADELARPLPAGPIMGGVPRQAIVGAVVEHTAHHRGALSVYSRLLGLVPAMPYMEG